MLLKFIDAIKCPICKSSRLWKLAGDFSDTRMATGTITCTSNHVWFVQEEVLRLDQENSDEQMQLPDRPLTGFPKEVDEEVRGGFLVAFENQVKNLVSSSDEPLIIVGHPILFMKYLPSTDREIIVINEDELILRQVQDIAVRKRIYPKLSTIRAVNVETLLPDAKIIYVFDNIPETLQDNEIALFCTRDPNATTIWEEEYSILMQLGSE